MCSLFQIPYEFALCECKIIFHVIGAYQKKKIFFSTSVISTMLREKYKIERKYIFTTNPSTIFTFV